jgi:antitoxin MazE
MKAELQKLGDAHAVIIPDAFLTDCGITKAINLRLENHRIIIEPLTPPRLGWFERYQVEQDIDVWQDLSLVQDGEDWEW